MKVFEQAPTEEMLLILRSLKAKELNAISRLVNIRLGKPRSLSKKLVELCINRIREFEQFAELFLFVQYISFDPLEFCEERLGASFDNPTKAEIDTLLPELMQKYGLLRTQFLFASFTDSEVKIRDYAKELLAPSGALALSAKKAKLEKVDQIIQPKVTAPEIRESRRAKARIRRERRATSREQQKRANNQNKKADKRRAFLKRLKRKTIELAGEVGSLPAEESLPVMLKRSHPHLSRYKDVDPSHEDVGKIGMTFIRFTGKPSGSGKERPVVVIAKSETRFIVRPIYSNAHWPAGAWRAVRLNDWEAANLSNPSFVGDETHKVKINKLHIFGELTLHDWNRVCLGETN